jgi:hypothetical protein
MGSLLLRRSLQDRTPPLLHGTIEPVEPVLPLSAAGCIVLFYVIWFDACLFLKSYLRRWILSRLIAKGCIFSDVNHRRIESRPARNHKAMKPNAEIFDDSKLVEDLFRLNWCCDVSS